MCVSENFIAYFSKSFEKYIESDSFHKFIFVFIDIINFRQTLSALKLLFSFMKSEFPGIPVPKMMMSKLSVKETKYAYEYKNLYSVHTSYKSGVGLSYM